MMKNSFLQMTAAGRKYTAKVMSFSGDVTTSSSSAQTQTMMQHFPFKNSQPSISFTLQMRDQKEAQYFQLLARLTQLEAINKAELVYIFWPQRGIMDWSGVILSCQAGEKVGQTSPIINIEMLLVKSMISERTWASSQGTAFDEIYAGEIPDIPLLDPSGQKAPQIMRPPRPVTQDGAPIQGPYLGPDGNWY